MADLNLVEVSNPERHFPASLSDELSVLDRLVVDLKNENSVLAKLDKKRGAIRALELAPIARLNELNLPQRSLRILYEND